MPKILKTQNTENYLSFVDQYRRQTMQISKFSNSYLKRAFQDLSNEVLLNRFQQIKEMVKTVAIVTMTHNRQYYVIGGVPRRTFLA